MLLHSGRHLQGFPASSRALRARGGQTPHNQTGRLPPLLNQLASGARASKKGQPKGAAPRQAKTAEEELGPVFSARRTLTLQGGQLAIQRDHHQ